MTHLETVSRNEPSLPRVILVALYLPGREAGLGLLKTLKPHLLYRSILLVVLSRSGQPTDSIKSYGLGIASYIIKPVTTHRWLSCFLRLPALLVGISCLTPGPCALAV